MKSNYKALPRPNSAKPTGQQRIRAASAGREQPRVPAAEQSLGGRRRAHGRTGAAILLRGLSGSADAPGSPRRQWPLAVAGDGEGRAAWPALGHGDPVEAVAGGAGEDAPCACPPAGTPSLRIQGGQRRWDPPHTQQDRLQ